MIVIIPKGYLTSSLFTLTFSFKLCYTPDIYSTLEKRILMKHLKTGQLAMMFTASFLGAGFVSGQEIMQFFGVFGKLGIVGMLLSIVLFAVFGYLFMVLANKDRVTAIDQIMLGDGKTILHRLFNGVSLFFLFGVTVIMLAGAGSLLHELCGVPVFLGSACLTILLAILSLKGMTGIVVISQTVVPILLVLVVIISLWSVLTLPPAADVPAQATNPLLGNWFFATLSFFSYNILASLAVLTPAAQLVSGKKTMRRGILLGAIQLLLLFACILLTMQRYYGLVGAADFPMQALAEHLSPILGISYAVLLLAAMFNGALSCFYGAAVQLFGEKEQKKSLLLLFWAIAFACSLAGFKELISVIFPLCGYAYLLAIPFTLRRFRRNGKPRSL